MQQYFEVDSGSRTLTIFHTEDKVSFDMEHYGGFTIPDNELRTFLETTATKYTVYSNPAEEHPTLAERRPNIYPDEDTQVGVLKKTDDGEVIVSIQTDNPVTITLTAEQTTTLTESITVGSVERYENGQYPVESVSKDGKRQRAQHAAD